MKKIGFMLLSLAVIVLSLAACGNNGNGGDRTAGNSNTANGQSGDSSGAHAGDGAPSSGGKKTIVFSAFWPDEQYEKAAKAYEAAHPGVTIKIQYGVSNPGGDAGSGGQLDADIEKFTTSTNAAMLSGKGPDLIDLRYLAADDYERHHLLEDLKAKMDSDKTFRKTDYFENVLNGNMSGNAIYRLPLSFSLSGMAGDQAALAATGVKFDDRTWTWEDFMKTGRELVQANGPYDSAIVSGEGLQVGGSDYFVRSVVADNYSLFVDETTRKASFDSPAFIRLLKQIKSMYDDGIVGQQGRGYFLNIAVTSPEDYLTTLNTFGKDTAVYVKPHTNGEAAGASFQSREEYGINANSNVKDEAWAFLKYLMDHTTSGLPVNKARFAEAVQALKDKGTITPPSLGSTPGKTFKVNEAQLDKLEGFAESASRKKNESGKILDIVSANMTAFFAGQKSAENVAGLIQNKAMTALNE